MRTENEISTMIQQAGIQSSTVNTPKALQSSRAVKGYLSKCFPDCTITHHTGHFYCSGFVRRGEKVVYYNSGDFRGGSGFMVRTAKHEKDFTGGVNQWPSLGALASTINRLLS
jgi:hypothetical protein